MISVDTKTSTQAQASASSSLLTLAAEEGDTTKALTFSELLKGLSSNTNDKVIQNGPLVLALEKDSKTDIKGVDVTTLVKTEVGTTAKEPLLELNPEVTKNLSSTELKTLANDAKTYLKTQITQSEGFKKSEIQTLPKTLKGLVEVAKKFGVDMSKITLEEITVDSKSAVKLETREASKESISPPKTLNEMVVSKEDQVAPQKILKDTVDSKVVVKEPANVQTKQIKKTDLSLVSNRQQEPEVETKEVQNSKRELTPLFKAQTKVKITTEQLVNTKINTITEQKAPKEKADSTLKMLLRGDSVSQKEMGFTTDFSVATARVIAPEATTSTQKSLESLLRGEQSDTTSSSSPSPSPKPDGLNIAKADSFEVKLNEAKQMTKYLSQDIKTAIEDYKSPFTRIKVQLNPQRLGEVDLTIVQRGKNLHINLSSNNTAINTLALNANDLKVQLTNNGINNASLNFNNNSSDSSQSGFGQQQQNSQHRRDAKDEYNYFDNEEKNEEILSSLEIVVPNYA